MSSRSFLLVMLSLALSGLTGCFGSSDCSADSQPDFPTPTETEIVSGPRLSKEAQAALAIAGNPNANFSERETALEELARRKEPGTAHYLLLLFRDKNAHMPQLAIIETFGALEDPIVLPDLERMYDLQPGKELNGKLEKRLDRAVQTLRLKIGQ